MRTIASLCPFPMSAGNFVGNTIEKVAVLPISIPPRKKYLVYSLFTRVDIATEPYPGRWTHHLLVSTSEELDGQLLAWLQEAYAFAQSKR